MKHAVRLSDYHLAALDAHQLYIQHEPHPLQFTANLDLFQPVVFFQPLRLLLKKLDLLLDHTKKLGLLLNHTSQSLPHKSGIPRRSERRFLWKRKTRHAVYRPIYSFNCRTTSQTSLFGNGDIRRLRCLRESGQRMRSTSRLHHPASA